MDTGSLKILLAASGSLAEHSRAGRVGETHTFLRYNTRELVLVTGRDKISRRFIFSRQLASGMSRSFT